MIVIRPSPFGFSKVYEFINYDVEGPKIPIYIQDMFWSEDKRTLFLADEKCNIKRLNLSMVIDEIYEDKKNKTKVGNDRHNLRDHLNPPIISNKPPLIEWTTKAHAEAVKSIEYVTEEDLIFSTGLDRKVKVWNAKNGEYIDSLQQKYDKEEPNPICFKKTGVVGLIGPDGKTRVDKEYTNLSQEQKDELEREEKAAIEREKQKAEEESQFTYQYRPPKLDKISRENSTKSGLSKDKTKVGGLDINGRKQFGFLSNANSQNPRDSSPSKKGLEYSKMVVEQWMLNNNATIEKVKASEELEKEIFDPYYNWNKISLEVLANKRSTPWKLHVNFDKNKEEFDGYIKTVRSLLFI